MRLFITFILAAIFVSSCVSRLEQDGTDRAMNNSDLISFEVGRVDIPYDRDTKVNDNFDGSVHHFQWEAGDKIRVFAFKTPETTGETHITDMGVFIASRSGSTTTFKGKAVEIDPEADKLFAVYPDKPEIRINGYSETYNSTYFYKVFTAIDTEQTGNASSHLILASNTGKIDPSSGTIITSPSFKVSTPIIRFSVTPDKNISQIIISVNGANFAGSNIQMRTTMMGLNSGWDKSVITLKNGAVLASKGETTSLSFASGQITKGGIKISFKFIAADGSTCTRTYTTPKATVANTIYYIGNISSFVWTGTDLPAEGETAAQAVSNMGIGTSLCCTFECGLNYEEKGATRDDPVSFETMTARSKTTQQTMNALAAAGFKTIRIPVTWYPHMDNTLSDIDKVWLDRIGEVIDYAFNAGMYAIINVHADAGNNEKTWLLADYENYADISSRFVNIWGQIAQYFREYDYRLIFEGYNEIVDRDRTWFYPKESSSITAANMLNQAFVNIVRSSGGYNAYRNLCVNTFSAGTYANTLKAFVMPDDEVENHLMVQVHSYKPANFCTADLSRATYEFGSDADIAEIDAEFNNIKTWLLDKGYPCVLGEFGSFPMKERPDSERGHHAAVYVRKSLEKGIAPLYWYNPIDYQQRSSGSWTYPVLKDSIVVAYNKYIVNK